VDEEVAGAAVEVEKMGVLVFGDEVFDGGEEFDGIALRLGLGEGFGFSLDVSATVSFELGEEMLEDIDDGPVGADEREESVIVVEKRLPFGGKVSLAALKTYEAGGLEIFEKGVEDIGGEAGACGIDEGVEAFAGIGFEFLHGIEDAGVFKGPPGDEREVAGDEALSGLLREFASVGEHGRLRRGEVERLCASVYTGMGCNARVPGRKQKEKRSGERTAR